MSLGKGDLVRLLSAGPGWFEVEISKDYIGQVGEVVAAGERCIVKFSDNKLLMLDQSHFELVFKL